MQDINDNLSEVVFDVLGLPAAMAVKGKGAEGDNLTGFDDALANPELAELTALLHRADLRRSSGAHVGSATPPPATFTTSARPRHADGTIAWGTHPACACGIVRERHVSAACAGRARARCKPAFEYSDGMGSVRRHEGPGRT